MNIVSNKIIYSSSLSFNNSRKSLNVLSMKQKHDKNKKLRNYYETNKKKLSKEINLKIPKTIETCTNESKIKECLIMWDEIEELSATLNDIKTQLNLLKND